MRGAKKDVLGIVLIQPRSVLIHGLSEGREWCLHCRLELLSLQALNNLLCAIAMMHIEIYNCYPSIYSSVTMRHILCLLDLISIVILEVASSNSNVIDKTKTISKSIWLTQNFVIIMTIKGLRRGIDT
jgi:magnesium-transporting ATPase (P-type)